MTFKYHKYKIENFSVLLKNQNLKKEYDLSSYRVSRDTLKFEFDHISNGTISNRKFIKDLWVKEKIDGLPSCSQGSFITDENYNKYESRLLKVVDIVTAGNTKENYQKCLNNLSTLKKNKIIKRIPYSMLHRVFIGIYPDEHIDWASNLIVKKIPKWISEIPDLYTQDALKLDRNDWFDISTKVRRVANQVAKRVGLESEEDIEIDFVRFSLSELIKAKEAEEEKAAEDKVDASENKVCTTRKYEAKEIDVWLNEKGNLQKKFTEWLSKNGLKFESEKKSISGGRIDVFFRNSKGNQICELKFFKGSKLDESIKIRMALGQLLDYGLYGEGESFNNLILVVNKKPNKGNCNLLKKIKEKYGLQFNCIYLNGNNFVSLFDLPIF